MDEKFFSVQILHLPNIAGNPIFEQKNFQKTFDFNRKIYFCNTEKREKKLKALRPSFSADTKKAFLMIIWWFSERDANFGSSLLEVVHSENVFLGLFAFAPSISIFFILTISRTLPSIQ